MVDEKNKIEKEFAAFYKMCEESEFCIEDDPISRENFLRFIKLKGKMDRHVSYADRAMQTNEIAVFRNLSNRGKYSLLKYFSDILGGNIDASILGVFLPSHQKEAPASTTAEDEEEDEVLPKFSVWGPYICDWLLQHKKHFKSLAAIENEYSFLLKDLFAGIKAIPKERDCFKREKRMKGSCYFNPVSEEKHYYRVACFLELLKYSLENNPKFSYSCAAKNLILFEKSTHLASAFLGVSVLSELDKHYHRENEDELISTMQKIMERIKPSLRENLCNRIVLENPNWLFFVTYRCASLFYNENLSDYYITLSMILFASDRVYLKYFLEDSNAIIKMLEEFLSSEFNLDEVDRKKATELLSRLKYIPFKRQNYQDSLKLLSPWEFRTFFVEEVALGATPEDIRFLGASKTMLDHIKEYFAETSCSKQLWETAFARNDLEIITGDSTYPVKYR